MFAVVTGAAGFIGSHLTDALLRRGDRVVGIDAFADNYSPALKRANLATALHSPRFTLLEVDLVRTSLADVLHGCDVLFHLAGQPGVHESWGPDFGAYLERNVLMTQRVLEAAHSQRVGRVVVASSSSVYGATCAASLAEKLRPAPVSPYGVSKLAAEQLCFAYRRSLGVPVVVLRYFTCYGPRQRSDMAFSRFIAALTAGEPLHIYGDGLQARDFTYVEDTVTATLAAAEVDAGETPINVGSGTAVPILTAIRVLEQLVGRPARLCFEPARPGDMRSTRADLTRARALLGFVPTTSLAQGLQWQVEAQAAATPAPRA